MEINKQLFEDVFSCKLKGTFVLRNQLTCNSDELTRNTTGNCESTHPYIIGFRSYTSEGIFSIDGTISKVDIIDFIPDTDMKENELTIEIPNDKVIDWEESKKQNKIVLKDKQLTYEDVCKKLFEKITYYTNINGKINPSIINACITDPNNASTKHQLECILAKNKLANVAKYLNDEWEPNKTDLGHFDAWILYLTPNIDYIGYRKISNCCENSNVLFKSKELAQQAIEIIGEETVILALEPLGI